MRAAVLDLGAVGKRNRARLIELAEVCVGLGIAINKRLEGTAVGAALGHVNLVVAQQDLGVDHFPALRADAAGEFIEDVVCVLLLGSQGL